MMQLNPAGAGNTSQQEVIAWAEIKARKLTLRKGDTINLEVAAFSIGGLKLVPEQFGSVKIEIRIV